LTIQYGHERENAMGESCCGPDKLCSMTCCPCELDVEKIKPLVNEPKFICTSCGRAANEATNLCQPEPLE
jgi:hypothetical protein